MRAFPSLLLSAFLALTGLSAAPSASAGTTDAPRGLATPDLLHRAVSRGELSRGRADLFLAYAFAAPARLPARFRSDVPWDGTLPLLALRSRLERAPRSAERSEAMDLLAAPSTDCSGSVGNLPDTRTTSHFWIQYKSGAIGGGLTIDSYALSLETAWTKEVTSFGWPAPPLRSTPGGIRYHVAIRNLTGGLYGYVSHSGTYAGLVGNNAATSWDDRNAYASCMVLNADYSSFPSPPQASLDSTTAHEFVHSLQYGLGALHVPDGADAGTAPDTVSTDGAFTEGSATWMEDEVFDSANDNYHYLWPSFATSMGHYTPSPYPYWITWRGITERYGTGTAGGGEDVMQAFWEKVSRDDNWNVLTAMQAAVAREGTTLAEAFHAYAIAVRFNRACGGGYVLPYCLEEGPAYVAADPAIPTHGAIGTAGGTFSGSVADDYALNWVALPSTGPYDVRLTNTSGGGVLRGSVVCDGGAGLEISPLPQVLSPGGSTTPVLFDPSGCSQPVLVITNEAQTSANPSSSTPRTYEVATIAPEPRPLTVTRFGSGTVTSSPAGIDCGSTCESVFAPGSTVALTATPDSGYVFGGWGGACSGGGSCSVLMTQARAVTATFRELFDLSVVRTGSGDGSVASAPAGISCGTTCSGSFPDGTSVILTASPASGSVVEGWAGCDSFTETTCTLAMGSDRTVTATFSSGFDVAVEVTGTGSGVVSTSEPAFSCDGACSRTFEGGSMVTFEAEEAPGSTFMGWGGDASSCGTASTCPVALDGPKSVTATFDDVTPPGIASTTATPAPYALGTAIDAAWSASDGVTYEVQRRSASFRSEFSGYGLWLTTSATSAGMAGTPGRTYCFRTRARDGAGNPSVAFGPEGCTAIPVDDRALSRVGSWSKRWASGAYLGTYLQTRRHGARLLLDGVRAKRLAVVVTKCPGCGTIKVFLGKQLLRKVALDASVTRRRQLIPVATFPSLRTGRVRIKVVSADGRPVRVEGLGVSAA